MPFLVFGPLIRMAIAGSALAAITLSAGGLTALDAVFPVAGAVIEDRDVSTVSWGANGLGVLASDEGAMVQILVRTEDGSGARIRESAAVATRPGIEIDFEASTFLDGWFYVTGSHGAAKKKGTYSGDRARIYRFRLSTEDEGLLDLEEASLAPVFNTLPELASYHRRPLQQAGLNIEGLGARAGHLYVGLRSPNLNGDALVVRVEAESLFKSGNGEGELLRLPVGGGLGIRAMTSVDDGFLLVLGNAGSEPSKRYPIAVDYVEGRPSELYFWNPDDATLRPLGTFPRRGKGKEEGIFVLSESEAGAFVCVIVYDSIRGGGFQLFRYQPSE